MGEIQKRTDEIRVETEEQAKALIEKFKTKAVEEGFDIMSYTSTLKEKKSKGEVIDLGFNVTGTKKYNDFWEV